MPWTLIFGAIGALSISAFPATSGFTSKSLIIQGAINEHLPWVWLVLEIASAGVFLHAGIKFPYFVFFAKDRGLRPGETCRSMLIAMGFMSFMCIFLGLYPQPLYEVLPYEVQYQAYTFNHVISQLQLLMFSALVFFLFLPLLKRTETISIDTDWFYRKGLGLVMIAVTGICFWPARMADKLFVRILPEKLGRLTATPLTSLLIFYTRLRDGDVPKAQAFEGQSAPEESNIIPMGATVLASLVFLFSLFAVFVFLK
jgi:multicomponent Na+:H+ antiporter subunit D